CVG
ncbi:hypothetical protein VCHC17A1_1438B, partial [Vibrio cholerae HC-17A1]